MSPAELVKFGGIPEWIYWSKVRSFSRAMLNSLEASSSASGGSWGVGVVLCSFIFAFDGLVESIDIVWASRLTLRLGNIEENGQVGHSQSVTSSI